MTTGLRRAKLSHATLFNAVQRLESDKRFYAGLSGFSAFSALLAFWYRMVCPWSLFLVAAFIVFGLASLIQFLNASKDHQVMAKRLERAERKLNEIKHKE